MLKTLKRLLIKAVNSISKVFFNNKILWIIEKLLFVILVFFEKNKKT